MPLSDGLSSSFLANLHFKITTSHFKYLGINISRNRHLLFKYNFQELLDEIKLKLDKWKLLPSC